MVNKDVSILLLFVAKEKTRQRRGGEKTNSRLVDTWIRGNDPSAGSPTER